VTCERCLELQERVSWLESELGLQRSSAEWALLKRVFPASKDGHGANGVALKTIMALYHARGRPLSCLQIMEAVPPRGGGDDERYAESVRCWIVRARQIAGSDAIETVWGRGYRLSDVAMKKIKSVLEARL
jgi:DNA-binding response OmpR family regulator